MAKQTRLDIVKTFASLFGHGMPKLPKPKPSKCSFCSMPAFGSCATHRVAFCKKHEPCKDCLREASQSVKPEVNLE